MGIGCCIAQIALAVAGIVALIKGEFKLSANRVVRSGPARVVGALLILSLPLGFGIPFLYGAAVGAKKGVELAKQGKQGFNAAEQEALQKEIQTPAMIMSVAGTALPIIAAFCVAFATAQPVDRPRRYDDEDDRPRRRRRREDAEEDEDEDRPRRRRAEEDEEDDDFPRRRPPRDEDDDHITEK